MPNAERVVCIVDTIMGLASACWLSREGFPVNEIVLGRLIKFSATAFARDMVGTAALSACPIIIAIIRMPPHVVARAMSIPKRRLIPEMSWWLLCP